MQILACSSRQARTLNSPHALKGARAHDHENSRDESACGMDGTGAWIEDAVTMNPKLYSFDVDSIEQ